MARPLRIALYHVTSRGDRREGIYHDDKGRLTWLDVFSQVCTPLNSIRLTVKKAMGLAYASGDYTMKEISEWFCVHYSTVSRAVKLFEVNA